MHKDDSMTPKERMAAYFRGDPVDRIPTNLFLSAVGPELLGMTLRETRRDPRKEAFVQVECYKLLGCDGLGINYGLHGVGNALGSKLSDPENAPPSVAEFVLKDLKDMDTLDISKVERRNDPKLNRHYEAGEMMLEQVGDECDIGVAICGPFTAASSLYPTSSLLRAVRRDPEAVHRLLRFCTECIKIVCSELAPLGVSFMLCDPVASGTILRKAEYLEFVSPYTCELVEAIHALGVPANYHICGDTTSLVDSMVDTGIDGLSIDNIVDLHGVREKVGERVCIVGNVDPVDVMLNGTPDDIDAAVLRCLDQAQDSPCGYVLAQGCEIPVSTPRENVFRFMEAARRYGKGAEKRRPRLAV